MYTSQTLQKYENKSFYFILWIQFTVYSVKYSISQTIQCLRDKGILDSVLYSLLGLYISLQVRGYVNKTEKQRLGDSLFSLIETMYPDKARKITGMLLELDVTELMWMLEDQNALTEKVSLDSVNLLNLYTSLQVEKALSVVQAHQGKTEEK